METSGDSPTTAARSHEASPNKGLGKGKRKSDSSEQPEKSNKAQKTNTEENLGQEPAKARDEEPSSALTEELLVKQMMEEKTMYPDHEKWADQEVKLFEMLFLREYLPMMPSHWAMDFRGVPIPEVTFETSDEHPPLIYAHSNREARCTTGVLRMIDLTARVRSSYQTRVGHKVPQMIKRELDQFYTWAAEDGGYHQIRVVPNIVIEAVRSEWGQERITAVIESRMRALARAQREFYRVNRDPSFWDLPSPESPRPEEPLDAVLLDKFSTPSGKRPANDDAVSIAESAPDELATKATLDEDTSASMTEVSYKKPPVIQPPAIGPDELAQSPERKRKTERKIRTKPWERPERFPRPSTPETSEYSRPPPVVYGLFILKNSVLVLTADAAKGENGPVSFFVELDFGDRSQVIWNALTAALMICTARDELMDRLDDFGNDPAAKDSDPDA